MPDVWLRLPICINKRVLPVEVKIVDVEGQEEKRGNADDQQNQDTELNRRLLGGAYVFSQVFQVPDDQHSSRI